MLVRRDARTVLALAAALLAALGAGVVAVHVRPSRPSVTRALSERPRVGVPGVHPAQPDPAVALPVGVSQREVAGSLHVQLAGDVLPPRLAPSAAVTRTWVSWVQDGRRRRYLLLVPPGLIAPAPLVVSLHGWQQDALVAVHEQRWDRVLHDGVVVAYADGWHGSWDAGACCGDAVTEHVDDVHYLDALLARVEAQVPVDRHRVGLAGFSNGAMMAYRYACARSSVVAGVVAVAGTLEVPSCAARTRFAVLDVHGTADTVVPAAGLRVDPLLRAAVRPRTQTLALLRAAGLAVRTVTVPGLTHAWATPQDGYDATEQGWRFLAAHPQAA